jgi:hypothetical protein
MVCGKVAKNQNQVENLKIRLIADSPYQRYGESEEGRRGGEKALKLRNYMIERVAIR